MRTLLKATTCIPALALMLLSAPACHRPSEPAERPVASPSERVFQVRGILHGVDLENKTVTVEHEEIPGFMAAMVMPFYYRDYDDIRHVPLGSGMEFRFTVGENDSWLSDVKVIPAESVQRLEQKAKSAGRAPRVREGDRMPAFQLTDQDGKAVTQDTFKDRATLLTFIFVRCPIPNFCPLMSSNFAKLQEAIAANPALAAKVHLLSISFDPEDTPEVLSLYADSQSANPEIWTHASGTAQETEKLTQAFSVYVREESGTYSHGLCTALVYADGTVGKIWRGNDWSVDEVRKELEALVP